MLRVRTTASGWTGGPGLYTSYFSSTTEDLEEAQACLDRVRAAFIILSAAFSSSVSLQINSQVDVMNPVTGEMTGAFIGSVQAPILGQIAVNSFEPFAVAALLRIETNNFAGGRRVRGRVFVSPLSSGSVATTGTLGSSTVAVVENFGEALLDVPDVDPRLTVWRRPRAAGSGQNGDLPARVGLAENAASVNVPSKVAVLTSRRD